jgi:hypothetical protein
MVREEVMIDSRLEYAKQRRASLKGEGVCINGRAHGKATHGVRCEHCWGVHKGTPRARSAEPRSP